MLPPRMRSFFAGRSGMLQFQLRAAAKRVSFHKSAKGHDGLSSLTQMIEAICKHVLTEESPRWKRIEHMLATAHNMDPCAMRFMRIQLEKCITALRDVAEELDKDPSFEYHSVPIVDWCSGRVNALPEDVGTLMHLRNAVKKVEATERRPLAPTEDARRIFDLPRAADTSSAHFHRPVHS
jgi:hypothetical protein